MTPQKPVRCVHCSQPITEQTKDHVFPKSWYPVTTPPGVQRWTVPSCKKCNWELGKIERELFIRLALCLDPNKAEASGLSSKAIRSMGIGAEGISLKESLHRRFLKVKIIRSMRRYELGTETLPGLGVHSGFPEHELLAIGIPEEQLRAVATKIVRGCEFAHRIAGKPAPHKSLSQISRSPIKSGLLRFQQWVREGKLARILRALEEELQARGKLQTGGGFYRRLFHGGKKGGLAVGPTKRGKGTKIIALADAYSLPLAVSIESASPHESQLVEGVLGHSFLDTLPSRLIGDKAYDSGLATV